MPELLPSDLLARFLGGAATEAERREVEAWATSAPANRLELERLQAIYHDAPAGEWNVDAAWRRVSDRLAEAPSVPTILDVRPSRRRWLAAAAAIMLVVAAGWVYSAIRSARGTAPQVWATAAGEQRTLTLDDGTRITLAPNSEIRMSLHGTVGMRRADLRGEAWFEVEHDPSRPFLVHAGGAITEVLGTSFLVQELPDHEGVRVALVSGRTSVRRAAAPAELATIMRPGELAILGAGAVVPTVTSGAQWQSALAWREGRLEFDDAPLAEVQAAFAKWYGVPLVLATPDLVARRFSGALRLDALDDALDVLTLSLGVRMERRADTIILR